MNLLVYECTCYLRNVALFIFVFTDFHSFGHTGNMISSSTSPGDHSRARRPTSTIAISSSANGVGGVGEGRGVLVVVEGSSARLTSLSAFTNYSVSVAAATAAGVGVTSETITCVTMEDGKKTNCRTTTALYLCVNTPVSPVNLLLA